MPKQQVTLLSMREQSSTGAMLLGTDSWQDRSDGTHLEVFLLLLTTLDAYIALRGLVILRLLHKGPAEWVV